jgi:uncharacterized membrane protein
MKEFIIIISSTWKFAATFPIAIYLFHMSFLETILYTNIGGFIGVVVFTMFSKGLIKLYDAFWPAKLTCKRKSKKVFTKRNRRLVMLKNKYGLAGIVILTPVLLSIPLGVFLNTKYYGYKKISYLYLLLSQFIWSVIYTILYTQMYSAIT